MNLGTPLRWQAKKFSIRRSPHKLERLSVVDKNSPTKNKAGIMCEEQTSLPTNDDLRNKRPIKKSVTFCDANEYNIIPNVTYEGDTEDVMHALWYSEEELDHMLEDVMYTINLIRQSNFIDEEQYTRRGLEKRTSKGRERAEYQQRRGRDIVFYHQRDQKLRGVVDPQRIAKCYKACTFQCQVASYMVALADMREISDEINRYRLQTGKALSKILQTEVSSHCYCAISRQCSDSRTQVRVTAQ